MPDGEEYKELRRIDEIENKLKELRVRGEEREVNW